MFVIDDALHAEYQEGEYSTLAEAVSELKRRADIPWDESPNQAPCMSWRTCGRRYEVVESDDSSSTWSELGRTPALEIKALGVSWLVSFLD